MPCLALIYDAIYDVKKLVKKLFISAITRPTTANEPPIMKRRKPATHIYIPKINI